MPIKHPNDTPNTLEKINIKLIMKLCRWISQAHLTVVIDGASKVIELFPYCHHFCIAEIP